MKALFPDAPPEHLAEFKAFQEASGRHASYAGSETIQGPGRGGQNHHNTFAGDNGNHQGWHHGHLQEWGHGGNGGGGGGYGGGGEGFRAEGAQNPDFRINFQQHGGGGEVVVTVGGWPWG